MPPELLAFLQATGQLPRNEIDLQSFLQQQNAPGAFGSGGPLPPGAGFAPPIPSGIAGPIGVPQNVLGGGSFQGQQLQPQVTQLGIGAPPGVAGPIGPPGPQLGGAPGAGFGAAQPPSPDLGPAAQPVLQPSPTGGAAAPAPGPDPLGLLGRGVGQAIGDVRDVAGSAVGKLGDFFGDVAGGVARARLGGSPSGFSFSQQDRGGPAAPTIGPQALASKREGPLPGVPRTGTPDVLLELGAQRQADEDSKRESTASVIGSVLGFFGALASGGGRDGDDGGGRTGSTIFGQKKKKPEKNIFGGKKIF